MKTIGWISLITAFLYICIGISYFLMPADAQVSKSQFDAFLQMLHQNPAWFMIQMWLFALTSMGAIAVVMTFTDYVKHPRDIVTQWIGMLAMIGYSVIMVMSFSSQTYFPTLADQYVQNDFSAQQAVRTINTGFNDWMGFSLVGIWFAVIHILGLKRKKLSSPLGILGIVMGAAYILAGHGLMLEIDWMTTIAAGLGGIVLGPVWFTWVGVLLLRERLSLSQ